MRALMVLGLFFGLSGIVVVAPHMSKAKAHYIAAGCAVVMGILLVMDMLRP